MRRRDFLRGSLRVAAEIALIAPLQACFQGPDRRSVKQQTGRYGRLLRKDDLSLPDGFEYRVLSREGDQMSDGSATPTRFDGMAAFESAEGTILIRNHENRGRRGEVTVEVPEEFRYDDAPSINGGCTRLVIGPERAVIDTRAVLGGTTTNCAGGPTPWGSWISCEESFRTGNERHGYAFEVDSASSQPVEAVPIRSAGRFVHEAVAYLDGFLYQTEHRPDSAFYRWRPDPTPTKVGDLAAAGGELEALQIVGADRYAIATNSGWPVGEGFPVEWILVDEPDPDDDVVRHRAHDAGAAVFRGQEGAWAGDDKIYFDCTEGGDAESGQIWEYDPSEEKLTLVYESPGPDQLKSPDNLTVSRSGDLFVCEDSDVLPQYLWMITPEGEISPFARTEVNGSEFTGIVFDASGETMFVNQQGEVGRFPAVTYAIWGPW